MRIAKRNESALLGVVIPLVLVSLGGLAQASTPPAIATPQCTAVIKTSALRGETKQGIQDPRLNTRFEFSLTRDGAIRVIARAGELEAEKKVYSDGHVEVALRAGDDAVSVTLTRTAVDVQRSGSRHRVDPHLATDDDWVRINRMVAGSKAVRLLRALAGAGEASVKEAPGAVALLSTDAMLGVLSGDVGAANRLGRRMQAAQLAGVRPAAVRQEYLGCYRNYADAVVTAMNEFWDCYYNTPWWDPYAYLCSFEWMLKAESAWFQFISCSAFPLRLE